MPAHSSLPNPQFLAEPLTTDLIHRPAWRLQVLLHRLRSAPFDEENNHRIEIHEESRRLRFHPNLPEVAATTLVDHLAWVADAPHLTDAHHDAVLLQALRPRAPGWQLTGVVAVLLAAGRRHAAEALIQALPRAVRQAAARRIWASGRVVQTGLWGQGRRQTVVMHARLVGTHRATVDHIRALVRRPYRYGTSSPVDLAPLVQALPERNRWRGQVWAGLLAAGPHFREADRALASMPHTRARDQLRGLLAQAASRDGRDDLARQWVHEIEGIELRSHTAARIADECYARGELAEVDRWLPAMTESSDPSLAGLATMLVLTRSFEVTGAVADRSTLAALRAAWQVLSPEPDPWCLAPRPSPLQRQILTTALAGGSPVGLRRHIAAPAVRRTLRFRLLARPEEATTRIAQWSDGHSAISDGLIADWLVHRPLRVEVPGPVGLEDELARLSLTQQLDPGFQLAWRIARRDAPDLTILKRWLHQYRHQHHRWPRAWEVGQQAERWREARAPRTTHKRKPLHLVPVDPLRTTLTMLGWPVALADPIRKGRSWCHVLRQTTVHALDTELVAEWAEGRWPRGLPDNLPPDQARDVRSGWFDPFTLVLKTRPRGRWWGPARGVLLLSIGRLPGTLSPVGLLSAPMGEWKDETLLRALRAVQQTGSALGLPTLGGPPVCLRPIGGQSRPGMGAKRLEDGRSSPSWSFSTDPRPDWLWLDLPRRGSNTH